jgi:hypothetical protein
VRRLAPVVALLACTAALAACGLGAGKGVSGVQLTVTQDFGTRPLGRHEAADVPGGETVMRFLERNFKVTTRYGGGFVQSIDGLAGGEKGGRPVDWFYYVNGIEAPRGAASTKLVPGDRVWWDRHDWGTAMRVPAVVGSFPEPFLSGIKGRKLPVRLECESPSSPACDEAATQLTAIGVPASRAALGVLSQGRLLRVLVGRWPAVRRNQEIQAIEEGPARSGVFARIDAAGRRITALDPEGRAVRTLGPGAGLIAATRPFEEDETVAGATWVVTGTDDAGVLAAARALDEGALQDKFALAVDPQGVAVALPSVRRGAPSQ